VSGGFGYIFFPCFKARKFCEYLLEAVEKRFAEYQRKKVSKEGVKDLAAGIQCLLFVVQTFQSSRDPTVRHLLLFLKHCRTDLISNGISDDVMNDV